MGKSFLKLLLYFGAGEGGKDALPLFLRIAQSFKDLFFGHTW